MNERGTNARDVGNFVSLTRLVASQAAQDVFTLGWSFCFRCAAALMETPLLHVVLRSCGVCVSVLLRAAGFEQLAAKFDFSNYKTLGDIGGSAGALSCVVAKAHPHLSCTTLDLPAVHAAAEQYIEQQGLTDRVKVGKGPGALAMGQWAVRVLGCRWHEVLKRV